MGRKPGLGVVTDTLTSDLNEGQEYSTDERGDRDEREERKEKYTGEG